ncbi:hypothetical protein HDU79_011162 [Rhizoclosmatium sp. JEL0117]|nr:hypothetical protein HDU79_011162 [Rhizoclosmatium sp. JEL0117]
MKFGKGEGESKALTRFTKAVEVFLERHRSGGSQGELHAMFSGPGLEEGQFHSAAFCPKRTWLRGLDGFSSAFAGTVFCGIDEVRAGQVKSGDDKVCSAAARLVGRFVAAQSGSTTSATKQPFKIEAPVRVVAVDSNSNSNLVLTKRVSKAVVATEPIKKGRIIGLFDGTYHYDFDFQKDTGVEDRYLRERYTFEVEALAPNAASIRKTTAKKSTAAALPSLLNPPTPSPKRKGLKKKDVAKDASNLSQEINMDDEGTFVLEGDPTAGYYGWVWEVNDVTQLSPDEDPGKHVRGVNTCREPNVERMELLILGWPFVFLVAVKDIAQGEELLMDYGNNWGYQLEKYEDHKTYYELLKPMNQLIKEELQPLLEKKNAFPSFDGPTIFSTLKQGLNPGSPNKIPQNQTTLTAGEKQAIHSLLGTLSEMNSVCAELSTAFCLPLTVQPSQLNELNYEKGLGLKKDSIVDESNGHDAEVDDDVVKWIPVPDHPPILKAPPSKLIKHELKRRKLEDGSTSKNAGDSSRIFFQNKI